MEMRGERGRVVLSISDRGSHDQQSTCWENRVLEEGADIKEATIALSDPTALDYTHLPMLTVTSEYGCLKLPTFEKRMQWFGGGFVCGAAYPFLVTAAPKLLSRPRWTDCSNPLPRQ